MINAKRDIVVCGAGMAGLSAAVAACEAGCRVRVLEKAGYAGGSAAISGGLVWTFADFNELSRMIPDGNPVLQGIIHGRLAEDRAWLAQMGVVFDPAEPQAELGHGIGQRMEPQQAIQTLQDRIHRLGGNIEFEVALTGIHLSANGGVRAVETIRDDGTTQRMACDAVVLATGGFQGNPELLARYVVPTARNVCLRANSFSTGDGLLAARAVGAATTVMDAFYGHALAAPPARFRADEFGEYSQYYGNLGIAVNLRGDRFVRERQGTGEEVLNQALSQQPGGAGFYVVDSTIYEGESRPRRALTRVIMDRARTRGADVVVGDDFEDLADGLAGRGVPRSRALTSLTGRTELPAASGLVGDDESASQLWPLVHPPFYAVAVKSAITFTAGGLAVDEDMAVLSRSGSSSGIAQSITEMREYRQVTIPGLYAAGADVGGASGVNYLGGLATALVTGRVAGMRAADTNGPHPAMEKRSHE